jgi:hypothetical protein
MTRKSGLGHVRARNERLRPSVRVLQCRRAMSRLTASLLVLGSVLAACGADEAPISGAGFTVRFQLSKGGTLQAACAEVSEVSRVSVRVLSADGLTPLPGWPQEASCATGEFVGRSLAEGTYTLELVASGTLADDPAATLFKLRRPLVLPADRQLDVVLAPEVAFLEVAWAFSTTQDLVPCAEVESLSLFLGTGAAGTGSYRKTNLDCTLGRFTIPTPLLPQNFTLILEAYARDTGLKLYSVTEQRLLERGTNPPLTVSLRPVGGELVFDWSFLVGAASVTACDDPRVAVGSLTARVTSDQGDDPIEAVLPCAGQRPVRMPGARFTQGRALRLTLHGEGEHRFLSEHLFVTGAGDTDLGLLTVLAVGSATVTVTRTATGSACPPQLDTLRVRVTRVGTRTPSVDTELPLTGGMAPVLDVPLGDYSVSVEGRQAAAVACQVTAERSITTRDNPWEPFEL